MRRRWIPALGAAAISAGTLADACSACHELYRENPGQGNRCVP
jgi:hypothetical protein